MCRNSLLWNVLSQRFYTASCISHRLETQALNTPSKRSNTIPEELGNLSNLDRREIYNNQLSGALPQSLTKLTKMEKFHFQGTGLCALLDAAFLSLALRHSRNQWLELLWIGVARANYKPCGSATIALRITNQCR